MTKILHISSGTILKFPYIEFTGIEMIYRPTNISCEELTEIYEQSYFWIKYKYSLNEFILFLVDSFYLSVFIFNKIPIDIKPVVNEFEIIL
jgi:hypothetical protein